MEAARAMAEGALRGQPSADVDLCPVGDGGEGTLDSLIAARGGTVRAVVVQDAAGNTTQAEFGLLDDGDLAWVESASAIGLPKIPEERRDAMTASSYGVGELMIAASDEYSMFT